MIKKFNMENVDCANCAAKMEEAIKKIDGVNDARVNFLTQKLVLDTDREDVYGFEEFFDVVKEHRDKIKRKFCFCKIPKLPLQVYF